MFVSVCVRSGEHLLGNLKLLHHPDLVVHLNAALDQLHLCAVEVREVKLVDFKLLDQRR